MKKIFIFLLMLSLLFSISTFGAEPSSLSVGWVSDAPEENNDFWNISIENALQEASDSGIIVNKYYSDSTEDYLPNLKTAAKNNDLIITAGFLFESAVLKIAPQNSRKKFVTIDFNPVLKNNQIPNVQSYLFKEHEGSFLAGVIAAMNTETEVIGFVGGMDFYMINKFKCGYTAGAKEFNPDITVLVNYADSFSNPFAGYYYASKQYKQNADVVFHAAGGSGDGVIDAAATFDFWAIGVDIDQSYLSDKVLASVLKNVGEAVSIAIASVVTETFEGGTLIELGLEENGVGYSDLVNNLTDSMEVIVDGYIDQIIAGDIIVPESCD